MNSVQLLVKDIESAVGGHDEAQRVRMLRSVTELFFTQADRLGDDHMQVFDEVIIRLAQEIDRLARIELSRKLSIAEKAPRKTVRSLALDADAEVATPILERSTLVSQDDMMIVITERGPDHLLALARRGDLNPSVTDALIQRGDGRVHAALLRNRSAQFSSFGMRRLARETPADATAAPERANPGRPPEDLSKAVSNAAQEIRTLAATGRLDEAAVQDMLASGRTPEALAAIALLSDMATPVIMRAYAAAQPDPMMFIARALGFGWATLAAVLETKESDPARPPDMAAIRASFDLLTVATAQRVLRFVSLRALAPQPTALSA